jgi:hypothetical protein
VGVVDIVVFVADKENPVAVATITGTLTLFCDWTVIIVFGTPNEGFAGVRFVTANLLALKASSLPKAKNPEVLVKSGADPEAVNVVVPEPEEIGR